MITYGHEKFIEEAINGVLMQESEFEVELIIANDCSPDNTNEIIQNIISNHERGNLIKYYKQEENIGMMPNFIFTLKHCTGKYIALCEGDDYWTDPLKLQKQVDFLEANEDYAICFHRVYELAEGKDLALANLNISDKEETYTIEDLAKDNFIHTPSVIFRNGLIKEFPAWFVNAVVGDYPLFLLIAKHGTIKYFPEPMAVYRRHNQGTWGNKPFEYTFEKWLSLLDSLIPEFNTEIQNILIEQKASVHMVLSNLYDKNGILEKKEDHLYEAIKISRLCFDQYINKKDAIIYGLKVSKGYRLGNIIINPLKKIKTFFKGYK